MAIRLVLPSWTWRIDGLLSLLIVLAMLSDRLGIVGTAGSFLNAFALFALGFILKRNLRRDVTWRDLRAQLQAKLNIKGKRQK